MHRWPLFVFPARPVGVAAVALAAACGFGSAWAQSAAPAPSADVQARSLAATCANCHGTNGQAKGNAVISLAGMPADTLVSTVMQYKTGGKTGTIMHQIAKGYTDEQIKLIAGYFAAQKK